MKGGVYYGEEKSDQDELYDIYLRKTALTNIL
jgi:hypothetical protein